MTFLEIAHDCIAHGWAVIPCWPKTKNPTFKKGEGGKNWENALGTVEQVTERWTAWPECNVAIGCNKSGIAVLDIDHGLPDESAWRAWCQRNSIPETYTVRTGRRPEFGAQMYFAGVMPDVQTFHLDGCSGQVKSMGGYVMASGSIHPDSGERYAVICEAALAPLPDVVRALHIKKEKADSGNPKVPKTAWTLPVHESENRTGFLLEQTGAMRNLGCGFPSILAHMRELNDDPEIIADPVDEDRLEATAANCAKYPVPPPPPVINIGKKTREGGWTPEKMTAFLNFYGIDHSPAAPIIAGLLFVLTSCPIDKLPVNAPSTVVLTQKGWPKFRCTHEDCIGLSWAEFCKRLYTQTGKWFVYVS